VKNPAQNAERNAEHESVKEEKWLSDSDRRLDLGLGKESTVKKEEERKQTSDGDSTTADTKAREK